MGIAKRQGQYSKAINMLGCDTEAVAWYSNNANGTSY